jgi:hypothetical protein
MANLGAEDDDGNEASKPSTKISGNKLPATDKYGLEIKTKPNDTWNI